MAVWVILRCDTQCEWDWWPFLIIEWKSRFSILEELLWYIGYWFFAHVLLVLLLIKEGFKTSVIK